MRGLIIGKFYPFHKGHCFLIDVALGVCSEVYVFICSKEDEHIKGAQRLKWVALEYPQLTVYHITEENSDAHVSNPRAPSIWSEKIQQLLGDKKIDYVFASEQYGTVFAENLQAKFLMVDMQRTIVPISGSEIRTNIYQHWDFLADSVKPDFVKIITVDGDEAQLNALAESLGALYIQSSDVLCNPEYDFPNICEAKISALKKQDYPLILYRLRNATPTSRQEEIIVQESAVHITVNNEEDIQKALHWWVNIIKNE